MVIQKVHRNGYDHAVRNTGVKIIDVESKEQLVNAVGPQTAMMYYLGGSTGDWAWETPVPLEECLAIARKVGYPVLVDAANMLPPWDNLRKLAALGTDLICTSGGQALCVALNVPGFWRAEKTWFGPRGSTPVLIPIRWVAPQGGSRGNGWCLPGS